MVTSCTVCGKVVGEVESGPGAVLDVTLCAGCQDSWLASGEWRRCTVAVPRVKGVGREKLARRVAVVRRALADFVRRRWAEIRNDNGKG